MPLQSDTVSHWLGANLKSALCSFQMIHLIMLSAKCPALWSSCDEDIPVAVPQYFVPLLLWPVAQQQAAAVPAEVLVPALVQVLALVLLLLLVGLLAAPVLDASVCRPSDN